MRPRRRFALAFSTLAAAAAREELVVSTQVVHRHGDRTPITPLADRSYWATIVPSAAELAALADGTAVVPADAVATHPAAGDGVFGTLSHRGVAQLTQIGRELRASLVERDGLLPPRYSASALAVRSTNFPRTLQSAQALLRGLYPPETRDSAGKIGIDVSLSDAMIPDPVPRRSSRQEALERSVLASEAVRAHGDAHEPLRIALSKKLRPLLADGAGQFSGQGPREANASCDEPLSWNKLAEVCKCLDAYGKLPASISAADVDEAAGIGAFRWRALMAEPELAALAMGEMGAAMLDHADRSRRAAAAGAQPPPVSTPRVQLWSAHDSTLFGLLGYFRLAAPAKWPAYGAQLRVDVLLSRSESETAAAALQPTGIGGARPPASLRFSLNGEVLKSALLVEDGEELVDLDGAIAACAAVG